MTGGEEFSPAALVLHVVRVLAEMGIDTEVDDTNARTAQTAAADLLRALRVTPSLAPAQARRRP